MDSPNSPDFLIVGTMKGGTTVLYDFICDHPGAIAASQKEIHYFSLYYDQGEEWYKNHFSEKTSGLITGEASPTYFDMATTPVIPKTIKNDFPDMKIILIVRDPLERVISHYNHFCKINKIEALQEMGPERFFNLPYANAVRETTPLETHLYHTLNFSCYFKKYKNYKSVFNDNLLVIHNDDLRSDPHQTMEKVQSFLTLEALDSKSFEQVKYSAGTSVDQLSKETRKKLSDFLYPDYEQFCAASGIAFSG